MARWLGTVLLLSVGCVSAPEEPVEAVRQAVGLMTPTESGVANAALGAALTACPGNLVYGTAPGVSKVWDPSLGLGVAHGSVRMGLGVACGPMNEALVVGANAYSSYFSGAGQWGLAKNGTFGSPIAAAPSGAQVVIAETTGWAHVLTTQLVDLPIGPAIDGGHVTSALWLDNTSFVVGDSSTRSVSFYTVSTGLYLFRATLQQTNVPGYGRSLAMGDVTPANPGKELIVGADGQVVIMTTDGLTQLGSLPGGPSFSVSLAIEPGAVVGFDGGTLDALWVGEPATDRVFRFIGDDAGVFSPSPPPATPSAFGASLAITAQAPPRVFIGAPSYSGTFPAEGAIYQTPSRSAVVTGRIQVCGGTVSCGLCERCYGGVVCIPLTGAQCIPLDGGFLPDVDAGTDAGSADAGSVDAGSADAGSVDAGGSVDASVPFDAGAVDAGGVEVDPADAGVSRDAGPERVDAGGAVLDAGMTSPSDAQFAAQCGCSSPLAGPALLLGLLLARRARRETIPARP